MGQLKQAGNLEETLTKASERIAQGLAMRKSCELFKKAEAFLEPYSKEFMSEIQAKEYIQQTGIKILKLIYLLKNFDTEGDLIFYGLR